jgi:uncharacterized protein
MKMDLQDPKDAVQFVRSAILGGASGLVPPEYKNLKAQRVAGHYAVPSRYNCLVPLGNGATLAYNSLYGSFAKWGKEDLAFYRKLCGDKLPMDHPGLPDFISGGFAVSSGEDESSRLEKYYRSVRFNPGVMNLTFASTLGCNFACDYCFQGQNKPKGFMTAEVQDAVIGHLARKASSLKRLQICWYGGEPTLTAGSIIEPLSDRMMEICRKNKIFYNAFMVTNGYLYGPDMAARLLKKRVTTVQVTLDGPADYHDSRRRLVSGGPTFEKIVGNLIEIVASQPVTILIRVNIDERNKDTVRALIDDLSGRGLSGKPRFKMYFAPVRASTEGCHSCSEITMLNAAYGRLEADLYRHAIEKGLSYLPSPPMLLGNCQAVRPNGMIVLPNGDLHKCWDTVGDPALKSGSIFDLDGFQNGGLHAKWLQWTPFTDKSCKACSILPSCVGFCAYKHLFTDLTRGEAASVPCPSWKFNLHERLFLRAEKKGVVTRDMWDEALSPTVGDVQERYKPINA